MNSYGSFTVSSLVIILSMILLSNQQRPVTNFLQFCSQSEKGLSPHTLPPFDQERQVSCLLSKSLFVAQSMSSTSGRSKSSIPLTVAATFGSQSFSRTRTCLCRGPTLNSSIRAVASSPGVLLCGGWDHITGHTPVQLWTRGHVIVVINGVLTHSMTITSEIF